MTVKFKDDARIRLRGSAFVSLAGRDLAAVASTLGGRTIAHLTRTFTRDEATLDAERADAQAGAPVGTTLADLNSFYRIELPRGANPAALVTALLSLDLVETAYIQPEPAPPPVTPNFETQQNYLDAPPDASGVRTVWALPGGRGSGIKIADVESCWRFGHEDLSKVTAAKQLLNPGETGDCPVYSNDPTGREHGTSVMGELVGDNNGFGVTGIASDADIWLAPRTINGSYNPAEAINRASAKLAAGDVVLLEMQTSPPSQPTKLVPIEYYSAEFSAIQNATAAGRIVVEAGANGYQNLDAAEYNSLFNRAVRDSGAILVGAGAPAGGGYGPPRSKLDFSDYGSRLDVQAWGRSIVTTGYGDLQGGVDANQWYTSAFSGTSGASPIVTGVVAIIQGVRKANGQALLTPTQMRTLLTNTGSAQQDSVTFPAASYHIGPLVNVVAAVGVVPNDAFGSATAITPLPFADTVNTAAALPSASDASEPVPLACAGVSYVTRSVWYTFTSPANAELQLDTVGSDFDTVIGIYTGTAQNALTSVACNDDIEPNVNRRSRVQFNAAAGVTYRVQIGSYENSVGGHLTVNAALLPPVNDQFSAAIAFGAAPFSDSRRTENATFNVPAGEPSPTTCAATVGHSVWYSFTPPAAGTYHVDTTGSSFDTVLGIYTGATQGTLVPVVCNDDPAPGVRQAEVSFDGVGGTPYRIQVSSYGADAGGDQFLLVAPSPPANDDFANALTVGALPYTDQRQTGVATFADGTGEPVPFACLGDGITVGHTVWYNFAPPTAGRYTIDTSGSDFDTVIGVYRGTGPPTLSNQGCNDDPTPGVQQAVFTFDSIDGFLYRVQISSYGEGPGGDLHVRFAIADGDSDGDGCIDSKELGPNHSLGGQRDPNNYWDFFDVTADRRIDLSDTLVVLEGFGLTPGAGGYDAALDRYAPNAVQPWRTAAAIDGNGIDLTDALVSVDSFGDDCN